MKYTVVYPMTQPDMAAAPNSGAMRSMPNAKLIRTTPPIAAKTFAVLMRSMNATAAAIGGAVSVMEKM